LIVDGFTPIGLKIHFKNSFQKFISKINFNNELIPKAIFIRVIKPLKLKIHFRRYVKKGWRKPEKLVSSIRVPEKVAMKYTPQAKFLK
jgi:hypothetical protein